MRPHCTSVAPAHCWHIDYIWLLPLLWVLVVPHHCWHFVTFGITGLVQWTDSSHTLVSLKTNLSYFLLSGTFAVWQMYFLLQKALNNGLMAKVPRTSWATIYSHLKRFSYFISLTYSSFIHFNTRYFDHWMWLSPERDHLLLATS